MPRARKLVTEKLDPDALHDNAIRKCVELHSPYVVLGGAALNLNEEKYYVVYTAPLGGKRTNVASRNQRSNATKLRDQLNIAWAEGYWSSGRG